MLQKRQILTTMHILCQRHSTLLYWERPPNPIEQCGYSLVVERGLAMAKTGVRFSLPAQRQATINFSLTNLVTVCSFAE